MRTELLYNPRLLCERLAEMSLEGRRLARLRGTVAEGLHRGHIDSLELLELLREDPPRVIYDIGANVGTWALLAKAVFPRAEVHCFEPLDRLKGEFDARTRGVAGIHRHALALGAAAATMPMRVTDFVDASSLLEMADASFLHYRLRPAGEVMVRVERLDDYVAAAGLPPPDLVKLDIQGYELEALRGAGDCLRSASAVLSEVSFVELYKGQCLFHDVVGFLAGRGFLLCALGSGTELGHRLTQADALFVSNRAARGARAMS